MAFLSAPTTGAEAPHRSRFAEFIGRAEDFVTVIGAAIRVARAADAGVAPAKSDLAILEIDPASMVLPRTFG